MTKSLILAVFISACLGLTAQLAAQTAPQVIFDGTTLTGWEFTPERWRVEDGAITGEIPAGQSLGRNEFIFWKGETRDFDLSVEFRLSGGPSANSGIQFRSKRAEDGHAIGYQADLDDGATWLGRIYDEEGRAMIVERGTRVSFAPDGRRWSEPFAKPEDFRPLFKRGEWNTYRVRAANSHVELWVNGVRTAIFDDHQSDAADYDGRLGFQLHSGAGPAKIQFRNVAITNLGRSELPPASKGQVKAAVVATVSGIKPVGVDGKPLNLDFEKGSLEGWTATGDAWKDQPIKGDTVSPRKPGEASRHAGDYWIGSYEKVGDQGTGTLTSPAFVVTQPWASFLVGGGKDPKAVRVELIEQESGKVIHTASGQDREDMQRSVVDLQAVQGKHITIRVIDESTGGWGHLNFDDFVFHATKPTFSSAPVAAAGAEGGRQNDSPVLWHLRPNPAKPTAIAHADAQKTVADMKVTHGFQVELIATEPDVRQPIAFAIDERGRLWIAEGYSYPNKQPEGKGKDRITICEDKDGDGIFETHKVFIEGLNLVSGLEVGFGGVWVGAAPDMLFIPDRNHDDVPDSAPEVLLNGWGYQDTHETLNSFSWGPDGWLYGNQGVFTRSNVGKPGATDAQRTPLRACVWRYHPVRREFEVFANGGSNQWGLDFNEAGHAFMTHCRSFFGGGGTTHVIRNAHYWNQTNSEYAPFIANSAPDFAPELRNYQLASARYDSGSGGAGKPGSDAIFGGHSHVGTMIYLGDNWPEIYRDHLFTNNLFGRQMNQQISVRQGSGYDTVHAGYDLMYTPDQLYMGIDMQCGPDGAVYAIDWYDKQHCHTPNNEAWDRSNGRIYRISWAATYKPVKVDLGALSDGELVALQTHRSEWYVRGARRVLQARAATGKIDAAAIAALRTLAQAKDTIHVLHALWTLHVIGALDAAGLTAAAQHADDLVRSWAVQLATERAQAPQLPVAMLAELAAKDPSPTVRLALASALPMLAPDANWTIGAALAAHGEDAGDRYLPKLIWSGLAPVVAQDLPRALALAATTPLPAVADAIRWYVARTPQGRDQLVAELIKVPEDVAYRNLRLFAFSLESQASMAMPAAWQQAAARFTAGDAHNLADQLSALFGDQAILAKTRAVLADDHAPVADRRRAFDLLKRVGDGESAPIYIHLLDHDSFRSAVIPLLKNTDDPAAAAGLLKHFTTLSENDRNMALGTLTSRATQALPLLQAVQDKTFDMKSLSAIHVRQMRNLNNEELNKRLDKLWGKVVESPAATKATIAKLKKAYGEAPLWAFDANAGKQIFQRTCTVCHTLNGQGGKLGPELTGSWRNGVDYFIENIVDPNAVVGENFRLNLITKKDGTVLSGMVDKETDSVLVVRTITEVVNVTKSEIESRTVSPQSIMPPGMLEALSDTEAINLLKYLSNKN